MWNASILKRLVLSSVVLAISAFGSAQYHMIEAWYHYLNSDTTKPDRAVALAVDAANNGFAFHVAPAASADTWVITKKAPYGNAIYDASFTMPINSASGKGFIAVDTHGNAFIAADYVNAGNRDIYVAKIDPTGHVAWHKTIGGTRDDYPAGIGVDSTGQCCVCCNVATSATRNVMQLYTYNSDGSLANFKQDTTINPIEFNTHLVGDRWFVTGADNNSPSSNGARYVVYYAPVNLLLMTHNYTNTLSGGNGIQFSYTINGTPGGGWFLALNQSVFTNYVETQHFGVQYFDNNGILQFTSLPYEGYTPRMVGDAAHPLYLEVYSDVTTNYRLLSLKTDLTYSWASPNLIDDMVFDYQGVVINHTFYNLAANVYETEFDRYDTLGHFMWSDTFESINGNRPSYGGMVDSSQNLWIEEGVSVAWSSSSIDFLTHEVPGSVLNDISCTYTETGGTNFNATLTLAGVAPAGGVSVLLTLVGGVMTFPDGTLSKVITVPAGSTSTLVPIKALDPATTSYGEIHGQDAGVYRSCPVQVLHH
jgi:hypothetical protein